MSKSPAGLTADPGYTLSFPDLERSIPVHGAETIFQSARRHGVRIVGACGGRGTCGTCLVHLVDGTVERLGDAGDARESEVRANAPPGKKKWLRACLVRSSSDCVVEIAPRSLAPVVRVDVDGGAGGEPLRLDPAVTSRDVSVPEATLRDPASDADRLMRALPAGITALDIGAAKMLPKVLRDGHWSLRTRVRANELIGFARVGSPTLGLAVDLGTTNVAAFLLDLESGACRASLGIENPQVGWGADVISRINHAIRAPSGGEELRVAALSAINGLAHDLCRAAGARTDDIVDLAICGNTAMHHLLLGLPVRQLARAPFVAAVRAGNDVKARDLGVAACPGAYVHLVPNVGGFVGGDLVAALLATEKRWSAAATSLVMDIGTNTEICLVHAGGLLSASCPSGPALEGGHISCGMRAAEGAIERVGIADGRISIRVIGDKEPIGLCGSGVLDALATLYRAHIVDARGRLAAGHSQVVNLHGKLAALLAPGVHFTQDDVRAVQLAKAAIRTGVELLLREAKLTELDIECFIIAGAFGAFLDVGSGIATGLFPDLPRERFAQVGNAAGMGVRQMLASQQARARAAELAAACRYLELSTCADFQKIYLHHIGFKSKHSTRGAS